MNEKRFIELQLGAAKAQAAKHVKDSTNEILNDSFRLASTALFTHAAASRDYWQAKLDELGAITPEWCLNMAHAEDGGEIGAGALAVDPSTIPLDELGEG